MPKQSWKYQKNYVNKILKKLSFYFFGTVKNKEETIIKITKERQDLLDSYDLLLKSGILNYFTKTTLTDEQALALNDNDLFEYIADKTLRLVESSLYVKYRIN